MQDIALIVDPETGTRDIAIGDNGDFVSVDNITTSLQMSLLTDSRADSSEVAEPLLRRGWIGDTTPIVAGHLIGSKLWLYEQSRATLATLNGVRTAAREALQWMLDRGVADNITVTTEVAGTGILLTAVVNIGQSTITRYFNLWNKTNEGRL